MVAGLALGAYAALVFGRRASPAARAGAASAGPLTAAVSGGLARRMIEVVRHGALVVDRSGEVVLANTAARSMGVVRGGRVSVPDLCAVADGARAAGEPRRLVVDLPGGRIGREPIAVVAHAAPLDEEGHVALLVEDVTESRRLEAVRRDFVGNVSHELKSPVAALRALAETLVLRAGNRPELAREYAARIAAEAERLSGLLADLLDLAAIESGRKEYHREPVEAADLLNQVVARYAARAEQKGTLLEWSAAPAVRAWADARSVEQTLSNLVDNAIKYSPAGARVTLHAEPGEDETVFTVADTGPGIPPAAVPRLFERFYRVDPGRSREEGGTGLGLAIAKHLVEAQGGRIWVDGTARSGTTIRFTAPTTSSQSLKIGVAS